MISDIFVIHWPSKKSNYPYKLRLILWYANSHVHITWSRSIAFQGSTTGLAQASILDWNGTLCNLRNDSLPLLSNKSAHDSTRTFTTSKDGSTSLPIVAGDLEHRKELAKSNVLVPPNCACIVSARDRCQLHARIVIERLFGQGRPPEYGLETWAQRHNAQLISMPSSHH